MEDKIITCPKCGSRHVASMPCVFTGIDGVYQLFCKDCGQKFEKTGQEIKEHFEEKSKQFTCPYCKGHDVILIDKYTNNIYEVVCKSCGKLLILTPDEIHEEKNTDNNNMKAQEIQEVVMPCKSYGKLLILCPHRTNEEKEDNTMKCQRCEKGWALSDSPEYVQEEINAILDAKQNTATTTTDGLATKSNTGKSTIFDKSVFHNSDYIDSPVRGQIGTTTTEGDLATLSTLKKSTEATIPDWSNYGWIQQGWQCPKCGAILSPHTSFCPFCSRQTYTPTVICGTSGSGEYVKPNVSINISKK